MSFKEIYKNRRVFLTDHTGFEGSWLSAWLEILGAGICGFSDERRTEPHHFSLLSLKTQNRYGEVRENSQIRHALCDYRPEIIFHFIPRRPVASRFAYPDAATRDIQGIVNLIEAARKIESVRAIIVITSEKSYENNIENETTAESTAKSGVEQLLETYRNSLRDNEGILLAGAKSGYIIGGGDYTEGKLVPELIGAAMRGGKLSINNPEALRPWGHVLDSLSGYLLLGQKLLEGRNSFAETWSFCTGNENMVSVRDVLDLAAEHWDAINFEMPANKPVNEAIILNIDSEKTERRLGWEPVWPLEDSVRETIEWYRMYYEAGELISWEQLESYIADAKSCGAAWEENANITAETPLLRAG